MAVTSLTRISRRDDSRHEYLQPLAESDDSRREYLQPLAEIAPYIRDLCRETVKMQNAFNFTFYYFLNTSNDKSLDWHPLRTKPYILSCKSLLNQALLVPDKQ